MNHFKRSSKYAIIGSLMTWKMTTGCISHIKDLPQLFSRHGLGKFVEIWFPRCCYACFCTLIVEKAQKVVTAYHCFHEKVVFTVLFYSLQYMPTMEIFDHGILHIETLELLTFFQHFEASTLLSTNSFPSGAKIFSSDMLHKAHSCNYCFLMHNLHPR